MSCMAKTRLPHTLTIGDPIIKCPTTKLCHGTFECRQYDKIEPPRIIAVPKNADNGEVFAIMKDCLVGIPDQLPPRKLTLTMETQPFEDVFPIENGDFPMSC